ncbi:MAG: hypothetical protein V1682_03655 [Candidatus Omnitrophota bacterium]
MTAKTLLISIRTAAIAAAGVFAIAALSAAPSDAAAKDKAAQLTISCDKAEYKKDEPISIDLKIKNTGDKVLYINKRFHIVPETGGKANGELSFSVISPSGEKLPCKSTYATGLPKTDYFSPLKPGEELAMERKPAINYLFDLSAPGAYKIEAAYQNRYGDEMGIDAFKEKIVSGQITVKRVD